MPNKREAISLVKKLADRISIYKIGPILFSKYGPGIIKSVTDLGKEVFLDLKLHDIPNTVAATADEFAGFGIRMFTVHTMGGRAMLQRTIEVLKKHGGLRPGIIGVTILTSISEDVLHNDLNVSIPLLEQVINLVKLAQETGLDGIVASPQEVAAIRKFCGPDLLIITPGIRPHGSASGDQKRIATPQDAFRAGADYIVVGRPITQSVQPVKVVDQIIAEIAS